MAKITWKSKDSIEQEDLQKEQVEIEMNKRRLELETAPSRVLALEDENVMLMMASAETYEQMYKENINLMLAIAEMYEMISGGMK